MARREPSGVYFPTLFHSIVDRNLAAIVGLEPTTTRLEGEYYYPFELYGNLNWRS